jgi:hypothetical protein
MSQNGFLQKFIRARPGWSDLLLNIRRKNRAIGNLKVGPHTYPTVIPHFPERFNYLLTEYELFQEGLSPSLLNPTI